MNQKGEVQPIGGVNQKVEGFYRVCKSKGITGDQGVLIPAANVDNLMLCEEVVEAVEAGRFHVYAVSTIEEGVEVLTGVPAGELRDDGTYPEGSVFGRAVARLEAIHEALKASGKDEEEEEEKEKRGAKRDNADNENDANDTPQSR